MLSGFNPFSLEGKTILITGASSGIGRCACIQCSKMGARIIALGRDRNRLDLLMQELNEKEDISISLDLRDQSELEKTMVELPLLDGVCLCAGISSGSMIRFIKDSEISELLEVNFISNLKLIRALIKNKKLANNGSIILISSIAAHNPSLGMALYSASKAALEALSQNLALELAPKKIRVNVIEPGIVLTEINNDRMKQIGNESFYKEQEKYPLGRFGNPKDIANGIMFLLSDGASWITGQNLIIDGGITLR